MARCCECGDPYAETMIDDAWFCDACLSGIDPDEDYYLGEPSDYAGDADWCERCGRYMGDDYEEYCDRCRGELGIKG